MPIGILESYSQLECAKENNYGLNILDAMEFLKDYKALDMSDMELEMCIMHSAFIVSDNNSFDNNYNVRNRDVFIDHVALIRDTDISAWCRKLYEYNLWNKANRVIVNILHNWLNSSLDNPTRFIP